MLFMLHVEVHMVGLSDQVFLWNTGCFDCASRRQVSLETFSCAKHGRCVPRVSVRPGQAIMVLYITRFHTTISSATEAAERETGQPNLVSPAQARTVHSA